MKRFFSSIALLAMTAQPLTASAQALTSTTSTLPTVDGRGFTIDLGFDPDMILTDADVFDVTGMPHDRLIAFLRTKGQLGDLQVTDIDGVKKTAGEVIWRVANSYKINPKFLVALLQKEQSLVEDENPSQRQLDWATGFGVCDDCSKDDPAIQNYKGFANQVEYAAKQMRERYYIRLLANGQTNSGLAPGKVATIDGVRITPMNLATASLYTYTPHIHGNQNLWRIWKRWFTRNFPDGTVVQGQPSKKIWWIRLGQKRPFESTTVAQSLVDTSKMIQISDTELAAYEDGPTISFPNYALLRDPKGRIWLLVGDNRRHILNMDAFRKFGFNIDEVEDVSDDDLAAYDIGESITVDTKYPQAILLKDATSKQVWYAENGKRYLIDHATILSMYFKNRIPKTVKTSVIESLENSGAYQLHDGELVKSSASPAVYVIEHGIRRPIPSAEVFEGLGWKWKNVVTLPASFLAAYDVGVAVQLDGSPTQIATTSK